MNKCLIAAICFATAGMANAGLKDAAKAGKFGEWVMLREIDSMTDKVSCTGVLGEDYSKQLSAQGLYVIVKGGAQSVRLRFNDLPPTDTRLATKMEKDVGSVIIKDADFQLALESTRIRVEVLTLVSGVQSFDINTSGIKEAVDFIKEGCPIQEKAASAPQVAIPVEPPVAVAAMCSDVLKERLKRAGLSARKIEEACRP